MRLHASYMSCTRLAIVLVLAATGLLSPPASAAPARVAVVTSSQIGPFAEATSALLDERADAISPSVPRKPELSLNIRTARHIGVEVPLALENETVEVVR